MTNGTVILLLLLLAPQQLCISDMVVWRSHKCVLFFIRFFASLAKGLTLLFETHFRSKSNKNSLSVYILYYNISTPHITLNRHSDKTRKYKQTEKPISDQCTTASRKKRLFSLSGISLQLRNTDCIVWGA